MAPEKSIAESEVLCEYCRKSFGSNTILKHIGHVKACKSFYGPRYDELKKEQQRKKVEKFRSKLSIEQRRNVLDRKNKMYAKNPEYRKKQVLENAKRRKKRALDQIEKNKKLQQEKNSRNENFEEKANFVEEIPAPSPPNDKSDSDEISIKDYVFFNHLRDSSFVDTTLTIHKDYKFNYLRKDNF